MIQYVLIGLFGLSVVSLISYMFSLIYFYKRLGRGVVNLRNTFPYELVPQFKTEFFYLNIPLFISLGSSLASLVFFMVDQSQTIPLICGIIGMLFMIASSIIPFINIKLLKEHLYSSLAMLVLYFALTGFLAYYSFFASRIYDFRDPSTIISMVISILLFVFALYFIFNPRLFDLKLDRNEEDQVSRPKVMHLAFMEWSLILSSPLIIVPLILLAYVL